MRKDASAGVDRVTYAGYQVDAWENIQKLHDRLRKGQYRAQPLRRVYIPKEDGRQRPISIPSLEDKIVQKAAVDLLNAIYEQDFLKCSHGFRPGRGAQNALDEVGRIICQRPISTVLEADITGYFDAIVRSLLMKMVEKRVSDGGILRPIGKWINVGVIDDGRLLVAETGTGQGQVISPLLANIYLHYVLDEWFEKVVKPRLKGEAYEVRFAERLHSLLSVSRGRGKGDGCADQEICKVWADAASGKDSADGVWAGRPGEVGRAGWAEARDL